MVMRTSTGFKIVLGLVAALALAGCQKKSSTVSELDSGVNGSGSGLDGGAMAGTETEFSDPNKVGDRVLFLVDQSTLTPEGEETLVRQAAWLKKYPGVSIQMEGHSDERGTREYNISLSARRATTSRMFLIEQGISADRIASIAFGKERPAALCDAENCWSQNRRSVTVITGGAKTS
jgi:peptidoglycan-associated lipoprotein